MSGYVYRFLNPRNEIIYVGYTNNIDRRIHEHFTRGHLPKICYKQTQKVQFKKYKTEADAIVMEAYYINTFKPIYNTRDKMRTPVTIKLYDSGEWKLYRSFEVKRSKGGIYYFLFAIIFALGIIYCIFG